MCHRRLQMIRPFFLLPLSLASCAVYSQIRSLPFKITISAPETIVAVNQPVVIDVLLTSTSKDTITVPEVVHHGQAELNYTVLVHRNLSIPATPTQYGRQVANHGVFVVSRVIKSLQPGEQIEETLTLNKVVDVSEPGIYTIRVARPAAPGNQDLVESNDINIDVRSQHSSGK